MSKWPAYMYNASGEAKIFASKSDVPPKGNWQARPHDHPHAGQDRASPSRKFCDARADKAVWPAWFDNKETGAARVFKCEKDVPKGWTSRSNDVKHKKAPTAAKDERISGITDEAMQEIDMTREEAVAILKGAGVAYHAKSKVDDLVKLVLWALEKGIIKED